MAISLTHTTTASGTDSADGKISKNAWNEGHTITMATGKLLGRTTAATGAVEEIDIGAWTAYTPTVTAASGTYTTVAATGAYKQIGKIVFLRIKVTITTNGTAAVNLRVTAPTGLTGVSGQNQPFACVENGVTGFVGRAYIGNTTTITVSKYDSTYLGGDLYVVEIGGSYETP